MVLHRFRESERGSFSLTPVLMPVLAILYNFQMISSIRCGQMTNYKKNSTWRELKAVEITLKGSVDFFNNKFVKIFTDNQNVERIS